MPRRYKLGADGQAHPAYFGKLPEEFTKEDTLRFLADTDIQLYRLLSADTHAALRAEGYEYKNGGLIPISEKETVMQEQTGGAPAATQEFQDTARRKRDLCRYAQPAGQKRGLP